MSKNITVDNVAIKEHMLFNSGVLSALNWMAKELRKDMLHLLPQVASVLADLGKHYDSLDNAPEPVQECTQLIMHMTKVMNANKELVSQSVRDIKMEDVSTLLETHPELADKRFNLQVEAVTSKTPFLVQVVSIEDATPEQIEKRDANLKGWAEARAKDAVKERGDDAVH